VKIPFCAPGPARFPGQDGAAGYRCDRYKRQTTTKELVSSIFGHHHKVLKTTGNLNNYIGLPLCIARMEGDEDIMVLEMGSNRRGDIKELCEIALPDFCCTNVYLRILRDLAALRIRILTSRYSLIQSCLGECR
jgi:UDP-N-acetylmuramyl pentapeptide synthase